MTNDYPLGARIIDERSEALFAEEVYSNVGRAKKAITWLPDFVMNYCIKHARARGIIVPFHKEDQILAIAFAYFYTSLKGSHRNRRRAINRLQGTPSFSQQFKQRQRIKNLIG